MSKQLTDAEVLRKARRKIANKSQRYICLAISISTRDFAQRVRLKQWVAKMLCGWGTYEAWMRWDHEKSYYKMTAKDFRDGRLQWLDWMISQCEKE